VEGDHDDVVELGELVSGSRPGRSSEDQITLYKSVGVAVQDVAAAALVLAAARGRSVGRAIELRDLSGELVGEVVITQARIYHRECLLKLRPDADGFRIAGYANVFEDPPGTDEDFGASSPTLLPDRRMVGGGKDGNFYLFDPTEDLSLRQIFLASYDARSIRATHHIHGSPVVFEARDGVFVYVWGENDYLRCFRSRIWGVSWAAERAQYAGVANRDRLCSSLG